MNPITVDFDWVDGVARGIYGRYDISVDDDLLQNTRIAAFRAAKRCKPSLTQACELYYIWTGINFEVINELRRRFSQGKRARARREFFNQLVSLDAPAVEGAICHGVASARDCDPAIRSKDHERITMLLATLSVKERDIVEYLRSGWKHREIGAILGATRHRISQIVMGIKQKIRRQLGKKGAEA